MRSSDTKTTKPANNRMNRIGETARLPVMQALAPLCGANQSFDLTFYPVNRAARAHCQGKKSGQLACYMRIKT